MKKLLVGYDGSDQAAEAAKLAARLASRLGATATVLTVGQMVTPIGTAVVSTVDADAFVPLARAGAEIVRGLGVEADERVELGSPVVVIRDMAAREAYDLIVLGHHGRGRVGEALLGSVAKAVATVAPCPVLVVPSRAPDAIGRILVAVGEPDQAERVMEPAALVARACGAAITLLHVIDPAPLTRTKHSEAMVRRRAAVTEEGRAALLAAAVACEASGIPCDALQSTGLPAETIHAVAEQRGYDLIVMGRSDRGTLSRVVLGSVSDSVLRRTTRPVLVVR